MLWPPWPFKLSAAGEILSRLSARALAVSKQTISATKAISKNLFICFYLPASSSRLVPGRGERWPKHSAPETLFFLMVATRSCSLGFFLVRGGGEIDRVIDRSRRS